MELPVFFQAEQAALAALLGVLLAALYDLLRALRRVLPGAAGFADGLFALVFFLSMLAFALYPGQGVFRLGFFLEIALGAAAYFLTLSRLLLQIFEGILRAIRQILHTLLQPVRFGAKKFSVFLKNLFARCKKWGTIIGKIPGDRTDSERGQANHETRQVFPSGEAGYLDSGRVRDGDARVSAQADPRKTSRRQFSTAPSPRRSRKTTGFRTPSTRWAPTRASRQSRAISSAWSTRAISSSMTWANDGRPFRRGVYAS